MNLVALIERVAEALGVSPVALPMALCITLVVMGVIGRITNNIAVWSGKIDARRQPQQAFTTQTPEQVVKASRAARLQLGCYVVSLTLSFLLCIGPFLLQKVGWLDKAISVLRLILHSLVTGP